MVTKDTCRDAKLLSIKRMKCLGLDGVSFLRSSFPEHYSGNICWEEATGRSLGGKTQLAGLPESVCLLWVVCGCVCEPGLKFQPG